MNTSFASMMCRLASLCLPALWAWTAPAQPAAMQLSERTVTIRSGVSPTGAVYCLSRYQWLFVASTPALARATGSQTRVEVFGRHGEPQPSITLPAGYFASALYALDDGSLLALGERTAPQPGWRLVKLAMDGRVLWDVPVVLPPGAPAGVLPARPDVSFHFTPGASDRVLRGLLQDQRPPGTLHSLSLAPHRGVVQEARAGWPAAGGRHYQITNQIVSLEPRSASGRTDPVLVAMNALVWPDGHLPLGEDRVAVDLWHDQLILQSSPDGRTGEIFFIAPEGRRRIWPEPLRFPLRNNGEVFYHFDPAAGQLTVYPNLSALLSFTWEPEAAPGKEEAKPAPPGRRKRSRP